MFCKLETHNVQNFHWAINIAQQLLVANVGLTTWRPEFFEG